MGASTFASILVSRAAAHCAELSTQVMLNIALSASRLGVHAEELHPMVEGIRQCTHRMNSFDMRQWAELQRKCRGTPVVQKECEAATMPFASQRRLLNLPSCD